MEFTDGKLAISANNPDLGEAVEEIEAEYKGKPLSIGFNARYLIDVYRNPKQLQNSKFQIQNSSRIQIVSSFGFRFVIPILNLTP